MKEFDLIVIGSGAAGLTAALAGAMRGADCVVLEHEAVFGGTSARSSGSVWIPDNPQMRAAGVEEDRPKAERYLRGLVGKAAAPAMWERFLDAGPRMIADLDANAGIVFSPLTQSADYRQDVPGAAPGSRAMAPAAFDGRVLGEAFARLAPPLPELTLFGGLMVTRAEAAQLLRADRSFGALRLALRLGARFLRDRFRHARGTRLVLGNALVGRLMKAALSRGVELQSDTRTARIVVEGGRAVGVEIAGAAGTERVSARRGVILAGGGFPASADWRGRNLPAPVAEHTPAAPGCVGATIELGLAAGGALGPSGRDNALWFPSSIATRRDGSTAVYPHIVLDRAKPGSIAVTAKGVRFVNEAASYHEFVRAMYRANEDGDAIPAWMICDRRFIRRYGLGLILPRTPSLRRHVRSGYLTEAPTLEALAQKIGAPPAALSGTVTRFNGFAATGRDEDFGRGETIYDRGNGDAEVAPNPCLGEIAKPPFYALPLWPTPLGTSRGLVADADARVLDGAGAPIPGLYVCGNDMQSIFGGEYPGAGAQLGQAMTFGWLAARHATGANEDA